MTRGIGQAFNTAKGSLNAAQTGLAQTSHNVSNVNTEGYSRQRVEMKAEDPVSFGNNRLGTGVRVGAVTRAHSNFLGKRIEEETTKLGRTEGMADIYSQIESVFKDDGEHGLSSSVSRFFNDVRTLSTQPESAPLRTAVKESAIGVTQRFQNVASGVDAVTQDLNRKVEGSVHEINSLTKKIGELNQRITEAEIGGAMANDERDSRDLAVTQLSKHIEIQTSPTENGSIVVSSGRMGTLVAGNEAFNLVAGRSPDGPVTNSTRIFMSSTADGKGLRDVTETIDSGALGGFVKLRDRDIPAMMEKIDTLAYQFADNVNRVHRDSFGKNGATGVNFFDLSGQTGAASGLKVNDSIQKDASLIASGKTAMAPGDNRALLALADLQDQKMFSDGAANIIEFTAGIVGEVGVNSRAVTEDLEAQQGVLAQLGTMREQISGVSLDEEAMNMLKFQKAFDASAKMIQVADNMLDTVINLKRF